MSRLSDLRKAIKAHLESVTAIAAAVEAFDEFILPDYAREELNADKPRIGVRSSTRELIVNEDGGPDQRFVTIDIGVVGLLPKPTGTGLNRIAVRQQQQAAADGFDDVMELALDEFRWRHPVTGIRGPLSGCVAGHDFRGITQPQAYDANQIFTSGVFVAVAAATYFDPYGN